MPDRMKHEPFLKWAGGKRWLVKSYPNLFPSDYNRYIEPFLGSGAVFFHLQPKQAILSDVNEELMNAYISIRDDHLSVLKILQAFHTQHSPDFYYTIRKKKFLTTSERAAQFIYLNRTCWNGLYRVNLKGQFNVPIGTKTNVLLDSDNFHKLSEILKDISLYTQDFEQTIDQAQHGDFLFVDPPYTVKHNNNGFVKYNETLFSWGDQIRLKNALYRAKERGAVIILTNADHESIRNLYSSSEKSSLSRISVIAGAAEKRGKYSELVINL